MERFKHLDRHQKIVLLFMAAMTLVFAVVYPMTIAKTGFAYKGELLVMSREDGDTVYSGKVQGQSARFTVHEDGTVEFQYGEKTYGPYTAREDPAAIPEDSEQDPSMTGVELRRGEDVLFRGGVADGEYGPVLFDQDGSWAGMDISVSTNGVQIDENGDVVDPMEPSASHILDLMGGPRLTHKGQWLAWFGGAAVCVLNALSMLFADELFRWQMSFRIRGADRAEPSEWEIMGRHISWTVLAVLALALYIAGLGLQ